MKQFVTIATLLISAFSTNSVFAIGPDTTAKASFYIAGKETKGNVKMYKQDYHNDGIPAEVMAEEFTDEEGKSEKIDFKAIDSIRIGDLLFTKSRFEERGITSMSESEMSLVRMLANGPKAAVYYAYSYDKKEKTYYKTLLVDKFSDKKPVDVQRGMWLISFKKQLTKLFEDCELVSKKAADKVYGSGKDAVILAAKDYNENCK